MGWIWKYLLSLEGVGSWRTCQVQWTLLCSVTRYVCGSASIYWKEIPWTNFSPSDTERHRSYKICLCFVISEGWSTEVGCEALWWVAMTFLQRTPVARLEQKTRIVEQAGTLLHTCPLQSWWHKWAILKQPSHGLYLKHQVVLLTWAAAGGWLVQIC